MYATALIVFREVLEAGLVIGIVLAATKNIPRRGRWILGGLVVGLLGAGITAGLADQLMSAMEGVGQEIFNATVLIIAVFMLGWHNIWMQRHGRELAGKLRDHGHSIRLGDSHISTLAVVVGLAILREGAEVVLFLHGIAASATSNAATMLLGGLFGIAGGVIIGLLIYRGLLRIPSRYLLHITTWLILLLAAGMAAQAAHYLEMANVLPSLGGTVWDTTSILPDSSIVGQVLHTLVGYTARPDVLQILAYIFTLILIGVLMKTLNRQRPQTLQGGISIVAAMALAAGLFIGIAPEARASHKVYSPHVGKGEFEFEARGHLDQDSRATHDNARKDIFEVGYGFTNRWFSSIFVEYEKEPGGHYKREAVAWENIFQLTETGKYWLDIGLYLEYESPSKSSKADKIELKLLLEKSYNRWVHTANFIVESEVGSGSSDKVKFGYAWRTMYRYKRAFEPGFELYGELGDDKDFGFRSGQTHQGGPIFTGVFKLGSKSKIKYEAGVLFGLSSESPDATFKWAIELEKRF